MHNVAFGQVRLFAVKLGTAESGRPGSGGHLNHITSYM